MSTNVPAVPAALPPTPPTRPRPTPITVVIPITQANAFADYVDMDGIFELDRFTSCDGREVEYESWHNGQACLTVSQPGQPRGLDFIVDLKKEEGASLASLFRGETEVSIPLIYCVGGEDGHLALDEDGEYIRNRVYFVPERVNQKTI